MALSIAVLASLGRHPASGRGRAADRDARALGLALALAPGSLHVIHAGDPAEPALREYLGRGAPDLAVLAIPAGADPVPALVDHLRALGPDLILAGVRAEGGEDSGMVPYLVAQALGLPLAAAAAGIALEGAGARILQALPRGQRRLLEAPLPLVVTVDATAPAPPAYAYARAGRARILALAAVAPPDPAPALWTVGPARRRPKRLRAATGATAEERLRAATQMVAGKGRLLTQPRPDEAARAIWDYLVAEGIVAPAARDATS